ncbi:MAG: fatty acid desaturase [Rhodovibrionaceae bacterium]
MTIQFSQPQGGDSFGRDLRRRVAQFQSSLPAASVGQIFTTIGGFLLVCAAMYAVAEISLWLVLPLAPLAAAFLVRTFIVQHDCGHGAFFRSRRANDALGFVCSLLTLTPYLSWRRQHAGHHGIWNDLDRRNSGADIYSSCLTVEEYEALGPWQRRWYRITRNPIVANLLLPPLVFLVLYRLPFDMPKSWKTERRAVYLTDLALVALFGGLGLVFGFAQVAAIHLPIMVMASIVGVWLFTVQHRSDHTIWARSDKWNALTASLEGSTHLSLPRLLRWFTGNIGLHHVHHLNPKVPNYRLQECHDSIPTLAAVPEMRLRAAFRATFYVLWDEKNCRMVRIGAR